MQLGFVSAILPDLSLKAVMEFAAAENYSCVELMCWPASKAERRYAGVTHVDVTEFSDDDAQVVNQFASTAGIEISGLGYYPNPLSPNVEEAEHAIVAEEYVKAGFLGKSTGDLGNREPGNVKLEASNGLG
jgi:sugar phosphate isomerase/epimerase